MNTFVPLLTPNLTQSNGLCRSFSSGGIFVNLAILNFNPYKVIFVPGSFPLSLLIFLNAHVEGHVYDWNQTTLITVELFRPTQNQFWEIFEFTAI